jgi:hypothetical protein
MTTDLPGDGGDSSGSVWMILVGAAAYCLSFSSAVATPLGVDPEDEDDDEEDESDESDDPHADSATAVATTAMAVSHFLVIGGPTCIVRSLSSSRTGVRQRPELKLVLTV